MVMPECVPRYKVAIKLRHYFDAGASDDDIDSMHHVRWENVSGGLQILCCVCVLVNV